MVPATFYSFESIECNSTRPGKSPLGFAFVARFFVWDMTLSSDGEVNKGLLCFTDL